MKFIFGKPTPSKMVNFWRVEFTKNFKDGTDVVLLPTRYALNASEKKRAQRKVDEINAKYHPDTYKPKHPRRFTTIQSASARLVKVKEDVGGIPVHLG